MHLTRRAKSSFTNIRTVFRQVRALRSDETDATTSRETKAGEVGLNSRPNWAIQ
jgi:hypothetical protein